MSELKVSVFTVSSEAEKYSRGFIAQAERVRAVRSVIVGGLCPGGCRREESCVFV